MSRLYKHYSPELKKYKWQIVILVFAMTGAVAVNLWYPFLIREITDIITQDASYALEFTEEIDHLLFLLFLNFFGLWFFWRIIDFLVIYFQPIAMRDMENRAFQHIQKHSLRFFKESFSGSLVKKIARFTDAFENLFDMVYFIFFQQFVKIIFVFVVFSLERPIMGGVFLLWSIVFLGGSFIYSVYTLKYQIEAAEEDSKVSAVVADSLGNFPTVKSFAREQSEAKKFEDQSQVRFKKRVKSWFSHSVLYFIQASLMLSVEFLLIVYSIEWWKSGTFSAGDFVFLQSYLLLIFHSLWDFGKKIQVFFRASADAEEMIEIFEKEIEVSDEKNAKNLEVTSGKIFFENMSFYFQKDEKLLYKNFNLHIQAGEKVALVGPSGGGKTTLTNLLLRFYDLQQGKILIDNQDISKVTQHSLRRNISVVPQSPDLFHRSIAENIAFGKPHATRDEIIKVAKLSHAHEFIDSLKNGYDTLVGERGVKLSGGERQRIAIARAFLEDAPILILDEATSALDSVTEKSIQNAMEQLMSGRTCIVIAHRLSTILHMDRIVVIKHGKIVEDGIHESLLQKDGLYAKLWNHQAGGFIGE